MGGNIWSEDYKKRTIIINWLLWAAEHLLTPVCDLLHLELLKRDVLHEPGKTAQSRSYMWLYCTNGDTDRPIVLYEYQPGRGTCHPKTFLAGFKRYLHTVGYSVYHNPPEEITVVDCWAHARRKFDEAMKSMPKGKAKNSSAAQGLAYCNLLFKIEEADLSPEERYDQRPYLFNYLKDGRLELSSNRTEHSIRPFVIDRKNFLFANTPTGAKGSAVIFSLIQTASENCST